MSNSNSLAAKVHDPVEILDNYIKSRGVKKGTGEKGNEETLNRVLKRLSKEPGNINAEGFRQELISACAVSLTGLRHIKEPVRLFRNLTGAFEGRGYCIYTQTVIRAFSRLERDAERQKRLGEIIEVWKSLGNPMTKANSISRIPNELAMTMLGDATAHYEAAGNLAAKPDYPLKEVEGLLNHSDSGIREYAARGLAYRKGLKLEFLKGLLNSRFQGVRIGASFALASRADFRVSEIGELLNRGDPYETKIIEAIKEGLSRRRKLTPSELDRLMQIMPGRRPIPKQTSTLAHISGPSRKRTEKMHNLTHGLRAKPARFKPLNTAINAFRRRVGLWRRKMHGR
ncbi:MAG: hypothetical protein V1676_05350 [Candidatus Diapherotrites archaeon]